MAVITIPKGTTDLTGLIANQDSIQFAEGEQTFTNTDQATLAAFADGLSGISFDPTWHGVIADSVAIKADVDYGSAPTVKIKSGGQIALWAGGASGVITKVEHFGSAQVNLVGGGTITNWEQANGRGRAAPVVTVTNFRMTGGYFAITYAATGFTAGTMTGGVLDSGRGWSGTLHQFGGVINTFREDTSTTLPTGATLIVGGKARHRWRGGDITNLYVLGPDCEFDARDVTKDITITNLYITGDAVEKHRNLLRGRNFTITISAVNPYASEITTFP